VLVHGALATGSEEWQEQRPLADAGYRLLVLDRCGYGSSPPIDGEDFLVDADDIDVAIGDGAHVVAHSYGGLGAMFAAARRPEAVYSLTLLEPPAFTMTSDDRARHLVRLGRPSAGARGRCGVVGDLADEVLDRGAEAGGARA